MMRVRAVHHRAEMVVSADGEVIRRIKKAHLAPGEMEHVTVKLEDLNGVWPETLTVQIAEGGL